MHDYDIRSAPWYRLAVATMWNLAALHRMALDVMDSRSHVAAWITQFSHEVPMVQEGIDLRSTPS
jgi:hypothetical protein